MAFLGTSQSHPRMSGLIVAYISRATHPILWSRDLRSRSLGPVQRLGLVLPDLHSMIAISCTFQMRRTSAYLSFGSHEQRHTLYISIGQRTSNITSSHSLYLNCTSLTRIICFWCPFFFGLLSLCSFQPILHFQRPFIFKNLFYCSVRPFVYMFAMSNHLNDNSYPLLSLRPCHISLL